MFFVPISSHYHNAMYRRSWVNCVACRLAPSQSIEVAWVRQSRQFTELNKLIDQMMAWQIPSRRWFCWNNVRELERVMWFKVKTLETVWLLQAEWHLRSQRAVVTWFYFIFLSLPRLFTSNLHKSITSLKGHLAMSPSRNLHNFSIFYLSSPCHHLFITVPVVFRVWFFLSFHAWHFSCCRYRLINRRKFAQPNNFASSKRKWRSISETIPGRRPPSGVVIHLLCCWLLVAICNWWIEQLSSHIWRVAARYFELC